MTYRRTTLSDELTPSQVQREFEHIEQAFNAMDMITLQERHSPPTKLRTGMTILADGTDWNPGSGQGVYTYYAGAWHKLG